MEVAPPPNSPRGSHSDDRPYRVAGQRSTSIGNRNVCNRNISRKPEEPESPKESTCFFDSYNNLFSFTANADLKNVSAPEDFDAKTNTPEVEPDASTTVTIKLPRGKSVVFKLEPTKNKPAYSRKNGCREMHTEIETTHGLYDWFIKRSPDIDEDGSCTTEAGPSDERKEQGIFKSLSDAIDSFADHYGTDRKTASGKIMNLFSMTNVRKTKRKRYAASVKYEPDGNVVLTEILPLSLPSSPRDEHVEPFDGLKFPKKSQTVPPCDRQPVSPRDRQPVSPRDRRQEPPATKNSERYDDPKNPKRSQTVQTGSLYDRQPDLPVKDSEQHDDGNGKMPKRTQTAQTRTSVPKEQQQKNLTSALHKSQDSSRSVFKLPSVKKIQIPVQPTREESMRPFVLHSGTDKIETSPKNNVPLICCSLSTTTSSSSLTSPENPIVCCPRCKQSETVFKWKLWPAHGDVYACGSSTKTPDVGGCGYTWTEIKRGIGCVVCGSPMDVESRFGVLGYACAKCTLFDLYKNCTKCTMGGRIVIKQKAENFNKLCHKCLAEPADPTSPFQPLSPRLNRPTNNF